MRTFRTPKGTELPLMDIKGKDYLQAAPRIFWLREEHPDWGIETELLSSSEKHAIFRATIRNDQGKILAQATSMETLAGFDSFLEKAETCAISRAASFCGYGTLMAQELEEQGKLADAPQGNKSPPLEFASEAQVKRLIAIQLNVKMPDSVLKNIAAGLDIHSRNEIPKDKYNNLCALVEKWKPENK